MKIIAALNGLGEYLNTKDEALKAQINSVSNYNAWFNSTNVTIAIDAWAKLLTSENLTHWVNAEGILENYTPKKVGLVLAGNIPMVGFHDILSVLITGHEAHIKLSSQDQQLIPMILEKLISIAPELKNKIFYPERLNAVDAVIATGSDNSARYFEYYFGNKPHIIRKNRNSIAVLSGNETPEEINILGKSFKPETNLTLGSPSLLLKNILEEYGVTIKIWDPYIDGNVERTAKEYGWNDRAQLFFIGTKHEAFHHFYFYKDSVIIDPFRYLKLKDDVKYIPIGICNQ